MRKMITIQEQSGVFCDAFVGNETGILFASLWGRNSTLHQMLARMELNAGEDNIEMLNFEVSEDDDPVFFASDALSVFRLQPKHNLDKIAGRITGTIYGRDLSQVFVYDKSVMRADYLNHRASIVYGDDQHLSDQKIWSVLKSIAPVPLLGGHWIERVLSLCKKSGYLTYEKGFGGISALTLNLDVESFESEISSMVKQKVLTLN